ncbi:hypothetical protein AcV5_000069 [Taiwanofungus camphoratus]|nr:hypothetical protein AcV5_000069 [Antrodia cinnamomea]
MLLWSYVPSPGAHIRPGLEPGRTNTCVYDVLVFQPLPVWRMHSHSHTLAEEAGASTTTTD